MSQWGSPKRFGKPGASFVAVPHLVTRNCYAANTPEQVIDAVHVTDRDSIDVDGMPAQAFVGKRYSEWLALP